MNPVEEPLLEIDDIQGNIEPGFRMPHQHFCGLSLDNKLDLQKLMYFLLPYVTSMRETMEYHEQRITIARQTGTFGFQSYKLIDQRKIWMNISLGKDILASHNLNQPIQVDASFAAGQYMQAAKLGDHISKDDWKIGSPDQICDVFLIFAGSDRTQLSAKINEILSGLRKRCSFQVIYQEMGNRLENDEEHFGFKDGISQPDLRGYVKLTPPEYYNERTIIIGNNDQDSPEFSSPGKILIWPGQFILGYPTQKDNSYREGDVPKPNLIDPVLKNGSYLVFRRLRQLVEEFYEYTNDVSKELSSVDKRYANGEYLRAKLVGRLKDGTSLVFEDSKQDNIYKNHFNYAQSIGEMTVRDGEKLNYNVDDPLAVKCPYFAHIRKVNPRDEGTNQGDGRNTLKFRILRRGIPYGEDYDHRNTSNPRNQTERGLLFVSYQSSISGQFELLINDWANHQINPEGGDGIDFIIGQGLPGENRSASLQVGNKFFPLKTMKNFVVPTGGEYYFTPSISLLKKLADNKVI